MYQEGWGMEGLCFAVSGYISDWRDVAGVSNLAVVMRIVPGIGSRLELVASG
jgi:hypothetical protein